MSDFLTAALFCSAVLSLLVTVALVLFALKQSDATPVADEESFSSMAVKESRERGLLHPGVVGGSLQLKPKQHKPKPNAAKSTDGTTDARTVAGGMKFDLASELRLKKHMEIVRWRQENERILSASGHDFEATQPQPPPSPTVTEVPNAPTSHLSDKSNAMQNNSIASGSE